MSETSVTQTIEIESHVEDEGVIRPNLASCPLSADIFNSPATPRVQMRSTQIVCRQCNGEVCQYLQKATYTKKRGLIVNCGYQPITTDFPIQIYPEEAWQQHQSKSH